MNDSSMNSQLSSNTLTDIQSEELAWLKLREIESSNLILKITIRRTVLTRKAPARLPAGTFLRLSLGSLRLRLLRRR